MNATLETIEKLRTIRRGNYSDKPVSDDDLDTILKSCVRAANASARQSYSIIVVADDIKQKLKWPGNKVLLFCVDFSRLKLLANRLNQPFDAEHILPFITGTADTSLAAQTAVITARSLGIDSMITNDVYTKDLEKTYELLDLPKEHCFPLLLVCLGYPKNEPDSRKGRLTGDGVIHHGKYKPLKDEQLDRMIALYDDPKSHMALIDAWREKGYKHYLEWFFGKWTRQLETREKSETIRSVLRRNRFL